MTETIVCLSSQRWDDGMWTNKQHIMSRVAKDHRVLHVNFGPFPLRHMRRRRRERGEPWWRTFDPREPLVTLSDGVEVLDFAGPDHRFSEVGEPAWIAGHFQWRLWLLRQHLRRVRIVDPVVWVYHPGYGRAALSLSPRLLVYDCVDEYSAFPEYRDDPGWIVQRERDLCRAADLVFTTSRGLFERKRPLNPHATRLVHNVGDAAHFAGARAEGTIIPADIASIDGPIIGFVGAVSGYKLDIDWLLALARARPDTAVVVIGPVGVADPDTDLAALEATANIHLLGHRNYDELPAYLKAFDVAVIPYRINGYTKYVFPIKFFEFMATGTPVVISALPSLSDFYDAVRVADDAEAFIRHCDEALTEAPDDPARARRIALAGENSWDSRVAQLMEAVTSALA